MEVSIQKDDIFKTKCENMASVGMDLKNTFMYLVDGDAKSDFWLKQLWSFLIHEILKNDQKVTREKKL